MAKRGTRGKYTPERVKIICDAIRSLKGRLGSAKEAGIHYDTFCEWYNKKPEFTDAIKRAEEQARQKGKEVAIMSIFNAMPKQWQAGAWWLERNFDEFVKNKEDKNGVFIINNYTEEQAKEIAKQILNEPIRGSSEESK